MNSVHTTIRPTTNIAAACATERSRYAMDAVYPIAPVDPEKCNVGRLVATDGRMLAVADAEFDVTAESPKRLPLVPAAAFPRTADRVELNGRAECVKRGRKGERIAADLVEGTFPPAAGLFEGIADPSSVVAWVGLNAELLHRLADAIAEGGAVTLGIPANPKAPVRVMGASGVGLLMPINTVGANTENPAAFHGDRWRDLSEAAMNDLKRGGC